MYADTASIVIVTPSFINHRLSRFSKQGFRLPP